MLLVLWLMLYLYESDLYFTGKRPYKEEEAKMLTFTLLRWIQGYTAIYIYKKFIKNISEFRKIRTENKLPVLNKITILSQFACY